MPSSTRAGVLGMTRTTATPSGSRGLEERGGDAGGELDHQLPGAHVGRDLVEQRRPCPAA